MKKYARIEIRLRPDQKEQLKEMAISAGLSLTAYLYAAGICAEIKNESEKTLQLKRLNSWLGRICGNLHALAKYANYNKNLASSAVICASLKNIEYQLKGLMP